MELKNPNFYEKLDYWTYIKQRSQRGLRASEMTPPPPHPSPGGVCRGPGEKESGRIQGLRLLSRLSSLQVSWCVHQWNTENKTGSVVPVPPFFGWSRSRSKKEENTFVNKNKIKILNIFLSIKICDCICHRFIGNLLENCLV